MENARQFEVNVYRHALGQELKLKVLRDTGELELILEVTERDEPQTVIGSSLQQVVYPDRYRRHVEQKAITTGRYPQTGQSATRRKRIRE
jgi:hypothetical protein